MRRRRMIVLPSDLLVGDQLLVGRGESVGFTRQRRETRLVSYPRRRDDLGEHPTRVLRRKLRPPIVDERSVVACEERSGRRQYPRRVVCLEGLLEARIGRVPRVVLPG